jgi:L-asparaginase II
MTSVGMPENAPGDAWVPVAEVVRSGLVESVHFGAVVVLGPAGEVEYAAGDPDAVVYGRSALKPMQAAGMVRAGLRLPADELALVAASHSGEAMHVAAARSILRRQGLDEAALQNTPRHPFDDASRLTDIRAGLPPRSVTGDCSGKHAGMVATCVINGWDVDSYLEPDHPLQQRLRTEVEELSGEPVRHTGVDGCGAPAWAVSLRALARAFGACATGTPGGPPREVADAMRAHPEMVGGTGRDVTGFMQAVPGLVAKEGAEAVYAAALGDGHAVCLKIADGGFRASQVVLASALQRLGVPAESMGGLVTVPVLGHGRDVGMVRAIV